MLDAIGVAQFDDLITAIDASVRLEGTLDLGAGMSEMAVSRLVSGLAAKNRSTTQLVSFAGAGCYDHYIPAFIDHILRKPEFFTAYTPYQPEVSQGTLQAIYEYQSAICCLTGMQVANASMYDGATALAEAALMAIRIARSKRSRILVADTLNPQWIEVLHTYAQGGIMQIQVVGFADLAESIDADTAAVLVGYPNYCGQREDIQPVIVAAHEHGALAVVAASPMLLALWENPGSLGADIVVGEAQCFASPQSFGGPGLGYFAALASHMRAMPGRIVGRTVDVDGKPGYVLTLSTREQHIRRERATSNICSNHALNALAAGAYLRYLGNEGLSEVAQDCVDKAHLCASKLIATGVFDPASDLEFGYEFALRYTGSGTLAALSEKLLDAGILAGVCIDADTLLVAVTEKRTTQEIEDFAAEVSRASH